MYVVCANRNLKFKVKVLKYLKGLSNEQLPMNPTHPIYLLQIHLNLYMLWSNTINGKRKASICQQLAANVKVLDEFLVTFF